MLKPAILYKEELLKKFGERIYTKGYFYYKGYTYGFTPPNLDLKDWRVQYAIVDENDKVIGFLSYNIASPDSVYGFGLYSFDEGNLKVIRDVHEELERLVARYHRVEWRCIATNHAARGYDNFCKKHGGRKITLYDVTQDPETGKYVDEYIYEIVKGRN